MSQDRREFLKNAALLSGALMLPHCKTIGGRGAIKDESFLKVSPVSSYVPKRVSWTSLSAADKQAFIDAVKGMKTTDLQVPATFGEGGERKSDQWAAQAEVHQWYCSHRNWLFLPWHRSYLHHFELFLRKKIRDDFRLPYWDWTVDQTVPIELQDAEFLKALSANRDGNVIAFDGTPGDSETKEWWSAAGTEISKGADYDTIGGDVESSGLIESPYHNMVHVELGGDMGMVPFAGKDPIFWLHHCNVDRLWSLWMDQIIEAGNIRLLFPSKDVGTWLNSSFPNHFWKVDGTLESATVKTSLFTEELGYNYDTMKKTWTLSDIPPDQAVVEQPAPVEKVDTAATAPTPTPGVPDASGVTPPPGLRLANTPGSSLSLNISFPSMLFDSPQALRSLRLKISGIPQPKLARLRFEVALVVGGKTLPLPGISFFPGAHAAHEGMIGISLNNHMNLLRSLAKNTKGGQLILTLKDRAGKAVVLRTAFPGISADPSAYGVKWKAVFG